MAKRGDIIGAIDFGSRHVRVLIVRQNEDGGLQVIGHGTAPGRACVSQGVIQDQNAAQMALKEALDQAHKEARVRAPVCFCAVNGKNVETFIRTANVTLDNEVVEYQDLEQAIEKAQNELLAAGKTITCSITAQEWYVDELRVIDALGQRGTVLKARAHFARMPATIEENLAYCIESQGRELEDVIFMPLASALGCLTPEDMELGVAVLDVGRSTTCLALYRDYRILASHVFEWGGYHITRDVSAGLQVNFDEAEELVLQYGVPEGHIRALENSEGVTDTPDSASPPHDDTAIKLKTAVRGAPNSVTRSELDDIIFERCKELMTEVRQYLTSRGLAKHLVRGIVLTGGAADLKNMPDLADAVFQVHVRRGYPEGIAGLPAPVNTPEYAAVTGVAKHGAAFRKAVRSGRVPSRGTGGSLWRRLLKWFHRYFL
ncbi:MAG: cell division protein FtsA [Candidatus Hydrogenedentota bacterium]